MGVKRALSGKAVVVFVCMGVGVGILVGALFGWHYSLVGLGAGLGPWIGAYFGNKKAREVDHYRDELIQGRRRQQKPDGSAR